MTSYPGISNHTINSAPSHDSPCPDYVNMYLDLDLDFALPCVATIADVSTCVRRAIAPSFLATTSTRTYASITRRTHALSARLGQRYPGFPDTVYRCSAE
jgi:hypothetical protein